MVLKFRIRHKTKPCESSTWMADLEYTCMTPKVNGSDCIDFPRSYQPRRNDCVQLNYIVLHFLIKKINCEQNASFWTLISQSLNRKHSNDSDAIFLLSDSKFWILFQNCLFLNIECFVLLTWRPQWTRPSKIASSRDHWKNCCCFIHHIKMIRNWAYLGYQ